ncbi:hypothetical protein STCU_08593 [Strigomonas culicis]|uniref:EF-hand domain-containing protein n=1 Tax=Strigomonas culicis TaxID=28005 RepID=S9V340_9TRYP|nr:hypothetical protein STCU_08593 [Strigomonas culicis]|eukprot:EPY21321.1 hypothetical protein STCU_08593 [Strigomonas culicis]
MMLANGDTTVPYEGYVMSYSSFKKAAYMLLFGLEDNTGLSPAKKQYCRSLYFSHPFLSPSTFLAFSRSSDGTVPTVSLYAFTAKRMLLFRLRVQLEMVASSLPSALKKNTTEILVGKLACSPSLTSPFSNGLSHSDIERFIGELMPNLRLVCDIPPWMKPYYLCHASRKFMFMCDTRNVGALSIDAFMKSDVFSELLRMFETDPTESLFAFPVGCPVEIPARLVEPQSAPATTVAPDETVPCTVVSFDNGGNIYEDMYTVSLESGVTVTVPRRFIYWNSGAADFLSEEALNMDNWFSLPLMDRIYDHFTQLDVDGDGVLTVNELYEYSNRSFTKLSIDRVFECHVPTIGTRQIMDFKTYLDFVIATEHAATSAAMKYIWKILDLDCTKTYVEVKTLYCFCKELSNELRSSGLMNGLSANSILSEIVDMINPEWHERITFEDVVRSGQQSTVLPILLSYRNFYAYDCREQTAATSSDEYTD